MTMQNAPAGTKPATSTATLARPAPAPAPPSWAWRRGALILAGAAQPITICCPYWGARERSRRAQAHNVRHTS